MNDGVANTAYVVLRRGWPAWRDEARALLQRSIAPENVVWLPPDSLFAGDAWKQLPVVVSEIHAPRRFVAMAQVAAHHREGARAVYLYRILWRLLHGEPHLLDVATDPDVLVLRRMMNEVTRSAHKAKAFVRFRQVTEADVGAHGYVAWHRPDHPILPLVADFFANRFSDGAWAILTPDESLYFDGRSWTLGSGQPRAAAPSSDELEDLWRQYYRATFNPARLMTHAMQSHMPKKYWDTLPEATEIRELVSSARGRVQAMVDDGQTRRSVEELIGPDDDLETLQQRAATCTGCPLHGPATQTVFGGGPENAKIVLVGEQPGDEEDRRGEPFVGPAGQVLRGLLVRAGLDVTEIYLTNAVKHFYFEPRGKRRLHARPKLTHVRSCRPWLIAELERLRPVIVVCLGSTASHSLLGVEIKVQRDRGRLMNVPWAGHALVTYHPSAVLRAGDAAHAREIEEALLADLRLAARVVAEAPP